MIKLKNALVLLLVFVLVAVGAVLPTVAARVQDQITAGPVRYADIDSLELILEERGPVLDMVEKLYLMLNGKGVEVTDQMTQMSEKSMIEALCAGLQPYVDMGFLRQELSYDTIEWDASMVYGETDPQTYNFYWYVHIPLDPYEEENLVVVLDDETGSILAMDYVGVVDAYYVYETVYAIADIYFNNLGIPSSDFMQVDPAESVYAFEEMEYPPAIMRFQVTNVQDRDVQIEICVQANGFYITLI